MQTPPSHCDSTAVAWFREALTHIETNEGLVLAAVAIARHQIRNAQADETRQQLSDLTDRVRSRVHSGSSTALLANLHHILFDEFGFHGNRSEYYRAGNSYLPVVLETKAGIPITLSLVYKLVAERLGLEVSGLNCPGHFMVRVATEDDRFIIDPFYNGQMLTEEEAYQRLRALIGPTLQYDANLFSVATHTDWIARMLRNLQSVFSFQNNRNDLRAMTELEQLLIGSPPNNS